MRNMVAHQASKTRKPNKMCQKSGESKLFSFILLLFCYETFLISVLLSLYYSDKTNSLSVKAEGGNFIGMVNEYCQKTQRSHTYLLEKRCGEAHIPQWVRLNLSNRNTHYTHYEILTKQSKHFHPACTDSSTS